MTQSELFEDTVKSQMSDFLVGKNALIFSYGVTNAGKTYTIQGKDGNDSIWMSEWKSLWSSSASLSMFWNVLGTPKDPGILPRVLDATFHYIGSQLYEEMDMKPYLRNDAQYLDPDQVRQERNIKAAIFASVKEVREF